MSLFESSVFPSAYLSPLSSPGNSFDDCIDLSDISFSGGMDHDFPLLDQPMFKMEPIEEPSPPSPIASVDGASETIVPAMLSRNNAKELIVAPVTIKKEESTEKKKTPPKKRKSWGQVLPKPTTNLPPRKRAKTEAEKEQRRIERVYRNRDAAQKSRERKRKEYEYLEDQNKLLKSTIELYHSTLKNLAVEQEKYTNEVTQCITKKASPTVLQQKLMLLPMVTIPDEPVFASFDEQNPLSPESMNCESPAATPMTGNDQCFDAEVNNGTPTEVVDSMQHPAASFVDDSNGFSNVEQLPQPQFINLSSPHEPNFSPESFCTAFEELQYYQQRPEGISRNGMDITLSNGDNTSAETFLAMAQEFEAKIATEAVFDELFVTCDDDGDLSTHIKIENNDDPDFMFAI